MLAARGWSTELYKGTVWGAENVLHLDCGGAHTTADICPNSELST